LPATQEGGRVPALCAARARSSLLALLRVAPAAALATAGSAAAAASVADDLEKAQAGVIDVLGGVLCAAASVGARIADELHLLAPPRTALSLT
jgi:hypothetical protein